MHAAMTPGLLLLLLFLPVTCVASPASRGHTLPVPSSVQGSRYQPLPRHAGVGSASAGLGSRVVLVYDVTEWSRSLRHGEVGVVQAIDDSGSNGFKRFLVERPNGEEVWHEQDEIELTKTQAQPGHVQCPDTSAPTTQSCGTVACALEMHYPLNATASSNSAQAAKLAGRIPTPGGQDCSGAQVVPSWIPDQTVGGSIWLRAHLGERIHIKDLTIYKRGAAGLIGRIEGFEPRYDGHKSRLLFDGVDDIACGKLVARMPSLTPWSVDQLHFAIAPAESWSTASATDMLEQGGIASIEIFGLVDKCYPSFAKESIEDTKLRKMMEEGFTGCSFSDISLSEANRRAGGKPEDLLPGQGDMGTSGDV